MTLAVLIAATALKATTACSALEPSPHDVFDLLTYNTHGLPALFARDDPESRFPRIAQHAGRFEIALLQEDFSHHEALEGSLPRDTRVERGLVSRFAFCPFCSGSGLTWLSRFPESWQIEVDAFPFETCAGWLTGLNDCFATKGFQLVRVRPPSGAGFFVVNTHLDAGRRPADRAARERQLDAIVRTIEPRASGQALIIGGDLNLDDTDPADRALLDAFIARLDLRDTGARGASDKDWAVLDYLLYREGETTRLEVLDAGEATEFEHAGEPLSDHPALFARIRICSSRDRPAAP